MSSTSVARTIESAAGPASLIEPAPEFALRYADRSFSFNHSLADHPAFEIPRLASIAGRLAAQRKLVFQAGAVGVSETWDTVERRPFETAEEAILHLDESNAWVELKNVQQDAEHKEILDRCIAELSERTGQDLAADITWLEAYIFVSSPRSVTPYHFDHETNFLMQIRGEKEIKIAYARDGSIVSAEELEGYYMGDLSAARYKPVYEDKADRYDLRPGKGVHIPSCSPHWVRNGDSPSIAYSINYCARSIDGKAQIHQANHYLRRLGFRPSAPGHSAFGDGLKRAAMGRWTSLPPQSKNQLLRGGLDPILQVSRLLRRTAKA